MAPRTKDDLSLDAADEGTKAFDQHKDASNNASLIPDAGKVHLGESNTLYVAPIFFSRTLASDALLIRFPTFGQNLLSHGVEVS